MNILNKINQSFQEYLRETGRTPKHIYVGNDEYVDLCREPRLMYADRMEIDTPNRVFVMGLEVFRVAENSHFYVC